MKKSALLRVYVLLFLTLLLPLPASAETPPHLGYGMMLAYPPGSLPTVTDAGFDWYKYFIYWDELDGNRDRSYDWDSVDWRLNEACEHTAHVLLRVERWHSDWTPIRDSEMAGWQAFFQDLAAHIAQKRATCATPYRVALEVWNEPNLDFQWGYQAVDPVRYTEMVKRAYDGAKAGAPEILIVAGSLAPTGGTGDGRAMNDVDFLEAMYDAGLQGHFDAISIHNYGFGGAPEDKAWGSGILNFRRAEDIHDVMVTHGDGDLPVWATEFGWLLESASCNSTWEQMGFAWQQVTAQQQADYLTRAFAYADANWPWMQTMIVSNLDFSQLPWYATCDPLRYFAIFNEDGSPRPAYTALQQMTKRPKSWAIWGMATTPAALTWMQAADDTRIVAQVVTVNNTGESAFDWTVTPSTTGLPVSVTPSQGTAGESITVTVDPRGLPLGTHSATVTIAADTPDVPESPITVPVRVVIVERVFEAYLPLIQR